jgi:hypothetical protein
MAGTLTISTLSDGTNSTSATNCIQGSAKSWVKFSASGGTVSVTKSYNASSITVISSGSIYQVNFTNAVPDANYCVVSCAGWNSSTGNGARILQPYGNATNTTTYCQFRAYGIQPITNEADNMYAAIFD